MHALLLSYLLFYHLPCFLLKSSHLADFNEPRATIHESRLLSLFLLKSYHIRSSNPESRLQVTGNKEQGKQQLKLMNPLKVGERR